jgi:hypothetical protein
MRKIIFIVLTLLSLNSFGQSTKGSNKVTQLRGILFFEKEQDVYTGYFIKSSFASLSSLLKNTDTVNVLTIGSPGDDANNIADFKRHLDKTVKFISLSFLVKQENHQGQQYEDTIITYSKSGCINYVNSKKYQLARSYKKIYFKDKTIVFVLQDYIPVESFVSKVNICKKKITVR